MKRSVLIIVLLMVMSQPVMAQSVTAPDAPGEAQELMPAEQRGFAEDLWYVVRSAIEELSPDITKCMGVCLSTIAIVIAISMIGNFPGIHGAVAELSGCIMVGLLLLDSTGTLISSASQTIRSMSDYAKLLLPVMATAMAAGGGVSGSTAIYTGTAIFDAVLCGLISSALIPIVYMFLALSVGKSALGDDTIGRLQKFAKWAVTWCLKTTLYIFTGYITVTGVISGTTDQAALKATKLTISGMIPVVGGILSDASEAVLVSAGAVKSAVGVYGLIAICAIAIGPFLRIGVQYLFLKATSAVCATFGMKRITSLIEDVHDAMGLLLGMTGAVCFIFLISMVCFMKGGG